MNPVSRFFCAGFVIWAAACAISGWGLSACQELNPAGYLVALPLVVIVLAWLIWREHKEVLLPGYGLAFARQTWFRRFRRPLPAVFLLTTLLIWLGGILYAPTDYDALTYRLPRMLNWWSAGHWFWIPTLNQRMNFSGTGWEWLGLPFLVFFHSDRGLFLINALGYLFMPGLLFSIFRRLGVARRVAWTWMWLLPLAYGYALQAGGIGNDLLGVLFALLAVDFGLRARTSGRASDVWLCLLAAALMSGVKLSNLPLGLPIVVAVWPALWRLIRTPRQWPAGLAVLAAGVMVSALPIMALNQKHTGSWTGDPQNTEQVQVSNPLAALLVNGVIIGSRSLVPPVLPHARELGARLVHTLPSKCREAYPRIGLFGLRELPGEEGSALGLCITLPLLLGGLASVFRLRHDRARRRQRFFRPPVVMAAWIAVVFLMAKLGSEAVARLALPYYPLALIGLLRLQPQRNWLRRRVWRVFLAVMALGVLPVLILSVSRPLWPAVTVTTRFAQTHPRSHLWQRLAGTYAGYAHRNDILAPVRAHIPARAHQVGFLAGGNDASYSLWRPLGQRRVLDLSAKKYLPQFLANPREMDLDAVVIKEKYWPEVSPVPLKTWAAEHHAKIVAEVSIVELISWGPEKWLVVHFKPEN